MAKFYIHFYHDCRLRLPTKVKGLSAPISIRTTLKEKVDCPECLKRIAKREAYERVGK